MESHDTISVVCRLICGETSNFINLVNSYMKNTEKPTFVPLEIKLMYLYIGVHDTAI